MCIRINDLPLIIPLYSKHTIIALWGRTKEVALGIRIYQLINKTAGEASHGQMMTMHHERRNLTKKKKVKRRKEGRERGRREGNKKEGSKNKREEGTVDQD